MFTQLYNVDVYIKKGKKTVLVIGRRNYYIFVEEADSLTYN